MRRPAIILFVIATMVGASASSEAATGHGHVVRAASYDVRITPTALPAGSTSIDIGPTLWSIQGFDLRGLLARVYGIDPARIELNLPASAADAPRFDISLPLAGSETDSAVEHILAAALQRHFHLAVSLEKRLVDVYVITAPHGAGPGLTPVSASSVRTDSASIPPRATLLETAFEDDPSLPGESISIAGRLCPGISSGGIAARSATMGTLAHTLEEQLERPIVDETHLTHAYSFRIPEYRSDEELFALLRATLGLEVTRAGRELAVLAIHPVADPSPDVQQAQETAFLAGWPLALVH